MNGGWATVGIAARHKVAEGIRKATTSLQFHADEFLAVAGEEPAVGERRCGPGRAAEDRRPRPLPVRLRCSVEADKVAGLGQPEHAAVHRDQADCPEL